MFSIYVLLFVSSIRVRVYYNKQYLFLCFYSVYCTCSILFISDVYTFNTLLYCSGFNFITFYCTSFTHNFIRFTPTTWLLFSAVFTFLWQFYLHNGYFCVLCVNFRLEGSRVFYGVNSWFYSRLLSKVQSLIISLRVLISSWMFVAYDISCCDCTL